MTLAELLKNLGFTSYQIAKDAGIHYPTLHRYLDGKSDFEKMSVGHAYRLAKSCGMSTDELFERLTKNK